MTSEGKPEDEKPPVGESLTEMRSALTGADPEGLIRRAVARPTQVEILPQATTPTTDQYLWKAIRNRTEAVGYDQLTAFLSDVFCKEKVVDVIGDRACPEASQVGLSPTHIPSDDYFSRVSAYEPYKAAVEMFLTIRCGVVIRPGVDGDDRTAYLGKTPPLLPYLAERIREMFPTASLEELVKSADKSPFCSEILVHRFTCPCMIELIWSYWHEEGMLVQAMAAVALRFQNRALPGGHRGLAQLTLGPLRPLSNLLWGYVQDDQPNRLSVFRRAHEYDHQYGLRLVGKALSEFQPTDSRSKFLEAFHSLLHTTAQFYRQYDNKMIVADAFPVLNALKEVHLILAHGADNQFGDLPWTARVEMLVQQYLLARHELREFLGGRPMVPYREAWMAQVDQIKSLLGWTDVSVTHFNDLARYGEQLLLSIRYGNWMGKPSSPSDSPSQMAKNWAVDWREEVQGYVHAYRVVTGIDLSDVSTMARADQRAIQPSALLAQRLLEQQQVRR